MYIGGCGAGYSLADFIEKYKKLSTLQYPRSISVTSAILISKVQPCPTFSGLETGLVTDVLLE